MRGVEYLKSFKVYISERNQGIVTDKKVYICAELSLVH